MWPVRDSRVAYQKEKTNPLSPPALVFLYSCFGVSQKGWTPRFSVSPPRLASKTYRLVSYISRRLSSGLSCKWRRETNRCVSVLSTDSQGCGLCGLASLIPCNSWWPTQSRRLVRVFARGIPHNIQYYRSVSFEK